MLLERAEYLAQIDDSFSVQFEAVNGGASGRGQANYLGEIMVPGKVFCPMLMARVIQGDAIACDRIVGCDMSVFAIVAALAGERQVIQIIDATFGARNDVFDRKGIG